MLVNFAQDTTAYKHNGVATTAYQAAYQVLSEYNLAQSFDAWHSFGKILLSSPIAGRQHRYIRSI